MVEVLRLLLSLMSVGHLIGGNAAAMRGIAFDVCGADVLALACHFLFAYPSLISLLLFFGIVRMLLILGPDFLDRRKSRMGHSWIYLGRGREATAGEALAVPPGHARIPRCIVLETTKFPCDKLARKLN